MAITPNFFIVGAAKAGTTSLWMYLKQHPDIFMPEHLKNKEPAYYCHSFGMDEYPEYLSLFSFGEGAKAIGEASHAYLTSPESAGWIHREIPEAKIIMVLRNPIERAYSLYRWMVHHGYESSSDFEEALKLEAQRKQGEIFRDTCPEYFYNFLYFESGLYSQQLKRYADAFGLERIKVVLFDDLVRDPVAISREIYSFLGVDDSFAPVVKVHNKADLRPFSIGLHVTLGRLKRRFAMKRIGRVYQCIFAWNLRVFKLYWPSMKYETRCELISRYHEDIHILAHMLGRDLSMWK